MNKKSGISMIVLVITIVMIIILMSTVALKMNVATNSEALSVFVNNLSVIEEYIASCNILKEDLPFSGELSLEEVRSRITPEYLNIFNIELNNNGDDSTLLFKKVDMSEIGIKKKFTGYEEDGQNDIYVYSELTSTVYYLKGVEIDGDVYFSLNDKVNNIVE